MWAVRCLRLSSWQLEVGYSLTFIRKKRNRSHTQTHNKNNTTHDTTRTTTQTTTRRTTPPHLTTIDGNATTVRTTYTRVGGLGAVNDEPETEKRIREICVDQMCGPFAVRV